MRLARADSSFPRVALSVGLVVGLVPESVFAQVGTSSVVDVEALLDEEAQPSPLLDSVLSDSVDDVKLSIFGFSDFTVSKFTV